MTARFSLLTILIFALLAVPAAAQDPVPSPTPGATPAPEPRIKPGVFAGGVDLSNRTVPEAAGMLEALRPGLVRNVSLSVAGKRFSLTMKRIRLKFDSRRSAQAAFEAGEARPPAPGARLAVPLAMTFKRKPIARFVRGAAKAVYLRPRNATITMTLRRMIRRRGKTGRRLDRKAVRTLIAQTVVNPAAPRVLTPGRLTTKPRYGKKDLGKLYPTVLTIDKSGFRLRLFKRLKLVKSYRVAVGLPGYSTPSGRFRIRSKQVNPTWTAPNAPWAGEFAGTSVPGGSPSNPLKARWMGIVGGVGIHGTALDYSIGTRASRGCIRMRVPDVIDLYSRVPVGTPVLIR